MRRSWPLVLVLVACAGEDRLEPLPIDPVPTEALSVTEARMLYPTAKELFSGRIQKTCSPNPGVCHNVNNYPDLRTAATMAQIVGAACNVDVPNPEHGYDGCEKPADRIAIGDFVAPIAQRTQEAPGRWRLTLGTFPPGPGVHYMFEFRDAEGTPFYRPMDISETYVRIEEGTKDIHLEVVDDTGFVAEFLDTITASLVEGDPNRNGILGGEDPTVEPAAMVVPGSLAQSYLWGRITGTVPGTRMPLANDALSNAEYTAVACWIETLPTEGHPPEDMVIDYDACAYAAEPIDPVP